MLFERDYRILTDQEKSIWRKVEEKYDKSKKDNAVTAKALAKYHADLPVAALHYQQLFPNNYLNTYDLNKKEELF